MSGGAAALFEKIQNQKRKMDIWILGIGFALINECYPWCASNASAAAADFAAVAASAVAAAHPHLTPLPL
jgi:hypothetical protein